MHWLNDLLDWLTLPDTQPILFTSAVLFLAIIVAGLLASWIASQSLKHHMTQRNRELKLKAINALMDAAIETSVWSTLTPHEQLLIDRAISQADIQLRLLPVKGSEIAANWAAYKLVEMKKNSATFGYQLEPILIDFRDRLTDWQNKPHKTRKEFTLELEQWRNSESSRHENPFTSKQETWITQQHHEQYASALQTANKTPGPNTEAHQLIKDIESLATPRISPSPESPDNLRNSYSGSTGFEGNNSGFEGSSPVSNHNDFFTQSFNSMLTDSSTTPTPSPSEKIQASLQETEGLPSAALSLTKEPRSTQEPTIALTTPPQPEPTELTPTEQIPLFEQISPEQPPTQIVSPPQHFPERIQTQDPYMGTPIAPTSTPTLSQPLQFSPELTPEPEPAASKLFAPSTFPQPEKFPPEINSENEFVTEFLTEIENTPAAPIPASAHSSAVPSNIQQTHTDDQENSDNNTDPTTISPTRYQTE